MTFLRNSRFTKPLVSFATDEYFHTLLFMFSAVVFVFFTTKDYIPFGARFFVPALLLLLVCVREMRLRAILLVWIVIGLVSNVVANFYVTANHGFMITYIGIALLIACSAKENGAVIMQRAALLLITILLGLALVQKVISSHYMDGNLIGTYLATGQMFKVMLSFVVPDWLQIVRDNLAAQQTLIADGTIRSIGVTIPPVVQALALTLTYTALGAQAALEGIICSASGLGSGHIMPFWFLLLSFIQRVMKMCFYR